MIEKLDIEIDVDNFYDRKGCVVTVPNGVAVINKINEIIDAINISQSSQTVDKFDEQNKWIGKLCRFWNDGNGHEDYIYEILIDIDDSDYPYKIVDVDSKIWTASFKHCEPVSEDLIYKGE